MGIENKFRSIQPDKGNNPEDNLDSRLSKDKSSSENTITSQKDLSETSTTKPVEAVDTIKPENYVQKNMFDDELGESEEKQVLNLEKSEAEDERTPNQNIESLRTKINDEKQPEEYYQLTLELVSEVKDLPENDPRRIAFEQNANNKIAQIDKKIDEINNNTAEFLGSLKPEELEAVKARVLSILEQIKKEISRERKEDREKKEKEVSPEKSKSVLEKVVTSYKEINYLDNTDTIRNFNARGLSNVTEQELNSAASTISTNLETNINKSRDLKNLVENYSIPDVDTKISGLESTSKQLQDILTSTDDEVQKVKIQAEIEEIDKQIKALNEVRALKNQIIMEITRINQEIQDLKSQLEYVEGEQRSKIDRSMFESSINSQVLNNNETLKIVVQ